MTGQYLTAWAVLDMDGDDFHSVHLFKEDAERHAFGLGIVVELQMSGTAERERAALIVERGLGFTRTGTAKKIREGGDL